MRTKKAVVHGRNSKKRNYVSGSLHSKRNGLQKKRLLRNVTQKRGGGKFIQKTTCEVSGDRFKSTGCFIQELSKLLGEGIMDFLNTDAEFVKMDGNAQYHYNREAVKLFNKIKRVLFPFLINVMEMRKDGKLLSDVEWDLGYNTLVMLIILFNIDQIQYKSFKNEKVVDFNKLATDLSKKALKKEKKCEGELKCITLSPESISQILIFYFLEGISSEGQASSEFIEQLKKLIESRRQVGGSPENLYRRSPSEVSSLISVANTLNDVSSMSSEVVSESGSVDYVEPTSSKAQSVTGSVRSVSGLTNSGASETSGVSETPVTASPVVTPEEAPVVTPKKEGDRSEFEKSHLNRFYSIVFGENSVEKPKKFIEQVEEKKDKNTSDYIIDRVLLFNICKNIFKNFKIDNQSFEIKSRADQTQQWRKSRTLDDDYQLKHTQHLLCVGHIPEYMTEFDVPTQFREKDSTIADLGWSHAEFEKLKLVVFMEPDVKLVTTGQTGGAETGPKPAPGTEPTAEQKKALLEAAITQHEKVSAKLAETNEPDSVVFGPQPEGGGEVKEVAAEKAVEVAEAAASTAEKILKDTHIQFLIEEIERLKNILIINKSYEERNEEKGNIYDISDKDYSTINDEYLRLVESIKLKGHELQAFLESFKQKMFYATKDYIIKIGSDRAVHGKIIDVEHKFYKVEQQAHEELKKKIKELIEELIKESGADDAATAAKEAQEAVAAAAKEARAEARAEAEAEAAAAKKAAPPPPPAPPPAPATGPKQQEQQQGVAAVLVEERQSTASDSGLPTKPTEPAPLPEPKRIEIHKIFSIYLRTDDKTDLPLDKFCKKDEYFVKYRVPALKLNKFQKSGDTSGFKFNYSLEQSKRMSFSYPVRFGPDFPKYVSLMLNESSYYKALEKGAENIANLVSKYQRYEEQQKECEPGYLSIEEKVFVVDPKQKPGVYVSHGVGLDNPTYNPGREGVESREGAIPNPVYNSKENNESRVFPNPAYETGTNLEGVDPKLLKYIKNLLGDKTKKSNDEKAMAHMIYELISSLRLSKLESDGSTAETVALQNTKNKRLVEHILAMRAELDKLQKERDAAIQKLGEAMKSQPPGDGVTTELQRMTDKLQSKQEEIEALSAQNRDLESEVKNLRIDLRKFIDENKELNKRVIALEINLRTQADAFEENRAELEEIKRQNIDLNGKNQELTANIERVTAELRETQVAAKTEECEELKRQLEAANREIESIQAQLNECIEEELKRKREAQGSGAGANEQLYSVATAENPYVQEKTTEPTAKKCGKEITIPQESLERIKLQLPPNEKTFYISFDGCYYRYEMDQQPGPRPKYLISNYVIEMNTKKQLIFLFDIAGFLLIGNMNNIINQRVKETEKKDIIRNLNEKKKKGTFPIIYDKVGDTTMMTFQLNHDYYSSNGIINIYLATKSRHKTILLPETEGIRTQNTIRKEIIRKMARRGGSRTKKLNKTNSRNKSKKINF